MEPGKEGMVGKIRVKYVRGWKRGMIDRLYAMEIRGKEALCKGSVKEKVKKEKKGSEVLRRKATEGEGKRRAIILLLDLRHSNKFLRVCMRTPRFMVFFFLIIVFCSLTLSISAFCVIDKGNRDTEGTYVDFEKSGKKWLSLLISWLFASRRDPVGKETWE